MRPMRPGLRLQLQQDRVDPHVLADVQVYREFFEDRPQLRAVPEQHRLPLSEALKAFGCTAEQERLASGYLKSIARDTRNVMGVYREGKRAGVPESVLQEVVLRGIEDFQRQRAYVLGKSEGRKERGDPYARFQALRELAESHGLSVGGDFDHKQHAHSHLDQLQSAIVSKIVTRANQQQALDQDAYGAQEPQEDVPQSLEEMDDPAHKYDDEQGRVQGHEAPKQPQERHRLQQSVHDEVDRIESMERRIQGTPFESAYQHLLREAQHTVADPSEQSLVFIKRRIKAFKELVTGSDLESEKTDETSETKKSLYLEKTTGRILSRPSYMQDTDDPQAKSAPELASDLRYLSKGEVQAHAFGGAVYVTGQSPLHPRVEDHLTQDALGGHWVPRQAAEEWVEALAYGLTPLVPR